MTSTKRMTLGAIVYWAGVIIIVAGLMLVFMSGPAYGQASTPQRETQSAATTVKMTFDNTRADTMVSFEFVFTGTPDSSSVLFKGCMKSGTCDTIETYTGNANSTHYYAGPKLYDYFEITPTLVGGTSPKLTVNRLSVRAASPFASYDVLNTAISAKAADSAVVHNTGNESIAGTKTFSTQPVVTGMPSACLQFPCLVATNTLTNQSAVVTSTQLLASATAGKYQLAAYVTVTQAATTSMTLPYPRLYCTDPDDSVAKTINAAVLGSTTNATWNAQTWNLTCDAKASTAINFDTFGYASSGATSMKYKIVVMLYRLN